MFAVWTAIAFECALRPSIGRFALLGVATGLLALVRPANQAFLVVGLLPLLLAAPWRVRIGRAVAFGGVTVAILAAWSTVNLVRFDDFTVARGGGSSLPLFRAFTVDHVVGPDNGPASRRLADAVERNLLGEEPYRSYGIDLATFFREGSPRMHEDLMSLSDRLWGWDSDYDRLGAAAWEGVRAHPGTYARGVLGDFWKELSKPLFAGSRSASEDTGSTRGAGVPPTVVVDGRELPEPTEGEPIPVGAPERPAVDARQLDPRGLDVSDGAPRRLRRPGEARRGWRRTTATSQSSTARSPTTGGARGSACRWTARRSSTLRSGCGSSSASAGALPGAGRSTGGRR